MSQFKSSKELVLTPAAIPAQAIPTFTSERELTVKDLWHVILRRKAIILGTLVVFVGAAIVLCALSTRRYQATGEVQVQKESGDALGLENMMGGAEGTSDALDANITIQTQAQMLQSDSLALKVIKDLKLEQNQDFQPKFSALGWALGLLSPKGQSDPRNVALEDAPGRRNAVLAVFRKNLKVKPVSGTRLIDVMYLNPDPKVAAAVVNHLIADLADYNFQTRYNATEQAAGWLGSQLSDLRKQSEDLQAKVVQLQRNSGVFSLGETDTQGREQVYTPALDRLQQATTQLTQAQSSRILKGAVYQVVKDGDPELISSLAGSGTMGSSGLSNSLTLIQNLRSQEATVQAQFDQLSAKFGPAYPKLAEVSANLDSIRKAIHTEAARISDRAKNDFAMASQVENNAKTVFADEKRQADSLNDKAIEYQIVRQEAVESRSLYENLLRKLKEAGVLAGLHSNNITIVDPARVPSRPAKPNILIYLAASLAGGLFVGGCGALLRDSMDNKIQGLPELEAFLGETPLGILPYHKEKVLKARPNLAALPAANAGISFGPNHGTVNSLAVITEPRGAYSEALRALRTSIMLVRSGAPPQAILVTSSVTGEGKSMLSSNLAILFAQQGKKVLLVDCDLRRPVLHRRWNVKNEVGLSSILSAQNIEETALSATLPMPNIPGLCLMTAGPIPPYPAELLSSLQMEEAMRIWRKEYDFIIMDGAPVLPVTDSVLLSHTADLTLVVARYKLTERQSLERSCALLQGQGTQKIAVVLNAVERSASTYYQYYGYNNSNYYGSEQRA